jgi:hypothetical protein
MQSSRARSHLLDGTVLSCPRKEKILENTETSMQDLMVQVVGLEGKGRDLEMRMCRINSGRFMVPREETKAVLERMENMWGLGKYEVVVVELRKAQS